MNNMFWSKSANSFFVEGIHDVMPEDVTPVTVETHQAMLEAQSSGKTWSTGSDGQPCAVDRVASPEQAALNLSAAAREALDASDLTVLRCFEHGVSVPSDWVEYRAALRGLINNPVGELPVRPPYPEAT